MYRLAIVGSVKLEKLDDDMILYIAVIDRKYPCQKKIHKDSMQIQNGSIGINGSVTGETGSQ